MDRQEMLEHLAMTMGRWPQDYKECDEMAPGFGWQWCDESPNCEFVLVPVDDDAEPIRERDWLAVSWAHGEERMENVGRNGGEALHYAEDSDAGSSSAQPVRELNPITSSMTHSQAREAAEFTGLCSDGLKCGPTSYCDECPNRVVKESLTTAAVATRTHDDAVNHPDHYQSDEGIECIDAIRAALGREGFIAHCRGTAIKYAWRSGKKAAHAEDLRKACVYLEWAAKAIEEGEQ